MKQCSFSIEEVKSLKMNKYGQNTRLKPFGSFSKQAKYVKCKS